MDLEEVPQKLLIDGSVQNVNCQKGQRRILKISKKHRKDGY